MNAICWCHHWCTREAGGGRERAGLEPQRPVGVLPGKQRGGRDRQVVGRRPREVRVVHRAKCEQQLVAALPRLLRDKARLCGRNMVGGSKK